MNILQTQDTASIVWAEPIFSGSPETSCPICLDDPIVDPQHFICGHVCCDSCLQILIKDKEQAIDCFACRAEITFYKSLETGLIHKPSYQELELTNIHHGSPESQELVDPHMEIDIEEWDLTTVVSHRGHGGSARYLVLWTTGELTWERAENFSQGGILALEEYRRGLQAASRRRQRARRRDSNTFSPLILEDLIDTEESSSSDIANA